MTHKRGNIIRKAELFQSSADCIFLVTQLIKTTHL